MGWIKVNVPDKLELEFRKIVMKKFNYKRGALTKGVIEAIETYIKSEKT